MKNWLKRLFAGKELDELERWRVMADEQRRWLNEFPDIAMALDSLIADGKGLDGTNVQQLRENIRMVRDVQRRVEYRKGYERRDAEVMAALV